MHTTRLDPETARRLLDGSVAPDDAPPGYAVVAELLASAGGAASGERVRETATVAAMRAVVAPRLGTQTIDPRRKNVRAKVLAAKTAAVTTVVLLGAGTAAAAAGSLPGAAQSTASEVLSKIGITVPGNNNDHANWRGHSTDHGAAGNTATSNTADVPTTPGTNRQGNGPNSHALPGLCRAQIASAGNPNANSVVPGIDCTGVTPAGGGADTTSGSSHPAGQSPSTPAGPPASTPAGPPASTPAGPPASTPANGKAPVSTPNEGTSSGGASGASSTGLSTASGHDGGAGSTGNSAASGGTGNTGTRP